MTISADSTSYSDPHVQFLSQILQDVRKGELLVPRFQRPFVWTEEQQLELLRSIRQGIPIGAIMVWRTSSAPISCYEALGPYPLQRSNRSGSHDYLLDGVQRLSTLYGALTPLSYNSERVEEVSGEGDLEQQVPLRAHYDLRDRDFLFIGADEHVHPHQLPLSIVFDSVALLRFQRSVAFLEDGDQLISECDKLAGAYRQYKLPVIPIATDDLALATLTFQRINSQGQKMSDYHMLHALTWSSQFDLMQQLLALRGEHLAPIGWADLDEDPILKVLKLSLGYDVYKADIHELSKAVKRNPHALEAAVRSIASAAACLRELSVPTHELVPYTLQIVLLADVFRRYPEAGCLPLQLLSDWFWFVTYSEAFSGISDDKFRTAHADLLKIIETGEPRWSLKARYAGYVPPVRYDSRAVKTKSMILTIARNQTNGSGAESALEVLAEYGRRGVVQAYPASTFAPDFRHLAFSFGNRVILSPLNLARLRRELALGSRAAVTWLIQTDSAKQDPADVVAERERALFEAEERFAAGTAGRFWEAVL